LSIDHLTLKNGDWGSLVSSTQEAMGSKQQVVWTNSFVRAAEVGGQGLGGYFLFMNFLISSSNVNGFESEGAGHGRETDS
jgi:hypothetical protein